MRKILITIFILLIPITVRSDYFIGAGGTSLPAGESDVDSVGDCADGACLDGSSDGGTVVELYSTGSTTSTYSFVDTAGADVEWNYTGCDNAGGGVELVIQDVQTIFVPCPIASTDVLLLEGSTYDGDKLLLEGSTYAGDNLLL